MFSTRSYDDGAVVDDVVVVDDVDDDGFEPLRVSCQCLLTQVNFNLFASVASASYCAKGCGEIL